MHESTLAEQQLIGRFIDAVQELPEVRAKVDHGKPVARQADYGDDVQVDLSVAGKAYHLVIGFKKTVFPRDVHQMFWKIHKAQLIGNAEGEASLPFIIAESISPGAKEILKTERIGYYDSGGSLFLAAKGAYFYIDKPQPKTEAKSARSLFTGARAQVIHTLLVHHQSWFSVKDLAKQAMVSPATASQVLTELYERYDWFETRGQGPSKERRVRDPGPLLDEWTKQLVSIRQPTMRKFYVPATKNRNLMAQIGSAFDRYGIQYAFSYAAAAQHFTPYLSNVSQVRVRMLFGPNTDDAIRDLGARPVNEGANLSIIETKSPGELLFRERAGDLWLASMIQIYLDLTHSEGRSKELAEHFRKDRIGF